MQQSQTMSSIRPNSSHPSSPSRSSSPSNIPTNNFPSSVLPTRVTKWLDEDGYLSRVVISPLLFISFIFSLMIVDRQTRSKEQGTSLSSAEYLQTDGSGDRDVRLRRRSSDSSGEYQIVRGRTVKKELSSAFSIQNRILFLIACVIISSCVMMWYAMMKMREMLAI